MRYLAILFATFILIACNTTPDKHGESISLTHAQDSILQYLLKAAASDFYIHRPPYLVRIRDVRMGQLTTPGGVEQYMLCGQFLPAPNGGKVEWITFATIKTSGYEQYIGNQAEEFCKRSSIKWIKAGDLASSLQNRFDSLQ